jgi:hypothetical protein
MIDSDSNEQWFEHVQPLDGIYTKGIAWRVNHRIMLEGNFDASSVGGTDPDLQDFGLRSMHAMTILTHASKPESLYGHQKIDSGFPRSFGIGINCQINPTTNLIFDYVREFPNNYYIEYTGNWESSLVTDYLRWRPDDKNVSHTFFLGMRYLHREADYSVPIHTGFFYTINSAIDPLQSVASLGFSLGTGLYLKQVTLGVAYRMKIWDTPNELLLREGNPEISKKMANQFLFMAHF